ncbi:MAG: glycosyltransferase, partial [Flavobacteriales bacterium]
SYIWISNPISDGTAISLYESMGYGCISVTSDLPATKEVITNDKNGVIAIKGISEGLERAIKMNLEEVQKINKEIIITTATKEVNKKKITDLYDEIIKNHD